MIDSRRLVFGIAATVSAALVLCAAPESRAQEYHAECDRVIEGRHCIQRSDLMPEICLKYTEWKPSDTTYGSKDCRTWPGEWEDDVRVVLKNIRFVEDKEAEIQTASVADDSKDAVMTPSTPSPAPKNSAAKAAKPAQ